MKVHDHELFVKEWMDAWKNGDSSADVGRKLGISQSNAPQTAMRLRRNGVDLPYLGRRGVAIQKDKLNAIIADVMQEERWPNV